VGHHQYFTGAVCGRRVFVPESNEKVGAQPDHFPAEVNQQKIGRKDQIHQTGNKGKHQNVETRGSFRFVCHIVYAIDQNGRADARGHQGEDQAQTVHVILQEGILIPLKQCCIDS